MANELWVEKYRPKTINDYVFVDENQKRRINTWIKEGIIPHLMLSGNAGVGKTTLAKVLVNELGIDPSDVLFINASSDNGIDNIRDKLTTFVGTMPFGEWKIIILDESDYLSPNAQACLRNLMEQYSNGTRFILTANYESRLIPALHSRCQSFHITSLDKEEFTNRIVNILLNENVELNESNIDILDTYIGACYPDMRKCINSCQQNIVDGVLCELSGGGSNSNDYLISAIDLFKNKKYLEARKLICSQMRVDEVEDLFRLMYMNLKLWADTPDKEDEAIVIIRDGMVKSVSCADQEINIAATLVELQMLAERN